MRLLLSILALLWLSPAVARAEPLPAVKTVEAYLNGISTLKARFVQTANDGKRVTGSFMLKRPGKMRFEYDPPVADFIVADGLFIYYYDGQMKQQSNVPIGQSLADFFLRPNLKLSGDIGVSGVRRDRNLLHVTLTQSKDPLAGSLVLMFSERPLQLRKWRIVDAQGLTTTVELFDALPGVKLKEDLFRYYDPARKAPSYN